MNINEISNAIRFANSGNIVYIIESDKLIILTKTDCYRIDEQFSGRRRYIKTSKRQDVEDLLRDTRPIDILKIPPNLPDLADIRPNSDHFISEAIKSRNSGKSGAKNNI